MSRDVVQRTRDQLDHVLVIDDGSDDETTEARTRMQAPRSLIHSDNRGKGEAIKTGLRHWLDRGLHFVVILDADGQHRPEEIERFVAAAFLHAEPKLIVGNRMNDVRGCRSLGVSSIAT